jgi:hypothetical protein
MKRKKKWIAGAIRHPGALKRKAKANEMSVSEFCAEVKKNPGKYSTRTKRQCSLAKTLRKMH